MQGDSLSIASSAVFVDKNAGMNKTVTVSGVSLSGSDAGNYTLTSTGGTTTATIDPRALTVSYTGVNKTYDGSVTATVSSTDNRVQGDSLSITRSAVFVDKNAGTGKTVTVSGASLTGDDAGNYTLTATGGTTTATIEVRPQSVFRGIAGGAWSNPANWDVMPEGANVASVLIPSTSGVPVVFDGEALAVRLQSLTNAGDLVLAARGLEAARISNEGRLTVGAGVSLDLSGRTVSGSGTLNNLGALQLAGSTLEGQLVNAGTVALSGINRVGSVTNSGRVTLADGITTLAGRYAQTAGATRLGADGVTPATPPTLAAEAVVIDGGSLQGTGRITGSVSVNGGMLAPGNSPGAIGIGGDLTLGSGANVALELGGTRAGSYDSLAVEGAARLGGTLSMSSVDGFIPAASDSFTVLSSGSLSGTFAGMTTSGTALAGFLTTQLKADVGGVLQSLPFPTMAPDPSAASAIQTALLTTQAGTQTSSASSTSGLSGSGAVSGGGSSAGSSGSGTGSTSGSSSTGNGTSNGSAAGSSSSSSSGSSSSGSSSNAGSTGSGTASTGATDLPVVRRSTVRSLELPDAPADKSSSREVRHVKEDKKDKTDQKEPAC